MPNEKKITIPKKTVKEDRHKELAILMETIKSTLDVHKSNRLFKKAIKVLKHGLDKKKAVKAKTVEPKKATLVVDKKKAAKVKIAEPKKATIVVEKKKATNKK